MKKIFEKALFEHSQAYVKALLRKDMDVTPIPAVIIVPGGSYTHISMEQAEQVANKFSHQHFQCFILRYSFVSERHPLLPAPLLELGQTIALIRENAAAWNVNPNQIIIMGFSVGGHIAALYNDYWDTDLLSSIGTKDELRPNAVVLGYPVIDLTLGFPPYAIEVQQLTDQPEVFAAQKHVTSTNVPTFTWGTSDDPLVPAENSRKYNAALEQHGIPHYFHSFEHGPHGLLLATAETAKDADHINPTVAIWFDECMEWLKKIFEK